MRHLLVCILFLAAACATGGPRPESPAAPTRPEAATAAEAPAATAAAAVAEPGHVRGSDATTLAACRRGVAAAAGSGEAAGPHGHHAPAGHAMHRFDDAAKWTKVFDDPARDAWQRPDLVLAALGLKPTDVVADVGAGTGYFAARFSKAVPQGRVLAQDVEPTLVAFMKERAAKDGLQNLLPVLGALDDPKLPEPADVVFVCDTYHHIAEPVPFFTKLATTTKPGARLVIVDFTPGELPVGPPEPARTPPARLVEELARAGWKLASFDCASLPHQYLASFTR